MTAVWMGVAKLNSEVEAGRIKVTGDKLDRQVDAAMAGSEPIRAGAAGGAVARG